MTTTPTCLDFAETWTCPKCHRPTSVRGTRPDVTVALDAVKDHHRCGHRAADRSRRVPVGPTTEPIPLLPSARRP